ncbi:hypothetical protein [Actinoplanes solisilvae]|uniref:hypothetical protein n=1 Tax=Actinoplanes solisilvae TaxID=2486853 RepID=UPI000FDA810E|nr:hypothetical protein [Actinoplanes solisilvae]
MSVLAPPRPGARTARKTPLLLLAAVTLTAAIPVVPGRLPLLSLLCMASLPFLAPTLLTSRRLGILVLVIGGWGLGLLFADLMNGDTPRVSQHVIALVGTLAITTVLIRLSNHDPVRLRLFIAAVGIGLALAGLTVGATGPTSAAFPDGQPVTPFYLWKYQLSEPITIAALALCDLRWRAGRRMPTFVTLVVLTALNVICDFRSFAVATLCTLLIATIAATGRGRLHPATVLIMVGVPCLLLIGGFFTAAKAGWLGERSMLQFRDEKADVWTVMANGRPEALQAIYLISQKPYGWGSRPNLDSATFASSLTFIRDHHVVIFDNLPKDWLAKESRGLAAHSTALDTVVQAGLLAVPFWAFLLFLGLRRTMDTIRTRAGPLLVFWTVTIVWGALFEPLTFTSHVLLGGYLAVVLLPLPKQEVTR